MAEILHMPLQPRRKAGRRRIHPAPNVPMGAIFDFPRAHPTLEDQMADYAACVEEAARGLLMAIRAVTALHRKYPVER